MSKTAILYKSPLTPARRGPLQFFRILLLVFVALRLIYGSVMELVPDEAYYWTWSRHLSLGYFDHPPMIAYVIWAGTYLMGSRELGVRLGIILMSVGAMAIIVALADRLLRDTRATVWVALMWITSPLIVGLGTICTPDTPVIFFSVCGLAMVCLIADRDDHPDPKPGSASAPRGKWLWILFGLFSGLAMVSKYTGILLPASIALAMLFSLKGLAHYRRPWIYLSGILAVFVFSPVILWNATHHWISFVFQLNHGTVSHHPQPHASAAAIFLRFFKDLGNYIGGQSLIWTPILFAIAIIVLIHFWRRYRQITQVDRVLLWSATLPLVLFGLATLRSHHTEANWPGFAYFPISILTARWMADGWHERRVNWMRAGVQTALGFTIVISVIAIPAVSRAMLKIPYRLPHVLADLTGWEQYGRWLGGQAATDGAVVMANSHQDAGEAAFYIPGQPEVWCVSVGTRPSSFDYFDVQPDFEKMPQVLWIGGHSELFCKTYGYSEIARSDFSTPPGHNQRKFVAFLLARSRR